MVRIRCTFGFTHRTPAEIVILLKSIVSRDGAQDLVLMSISFVVCGAGDVIDLCGRPAWFSAQGS